MSYNKNIEELNNIYDDNLNIQKNIIELLKTYENNNIKVSKHDLFIFKELKNRFKLNYALALSLLKVNIMNYSLYIKSLDKNIDLTKKEINKYLKK